VTAVPSLRAWIASGARAAIDSLSHWPSLAAPGQSAAARCLAQPTQAERRGGWTVGRPPPTLSIQTPSAIGSLLETSLLPPADRRRPQFAASRVRGGRRRSEDVSHAAKSPSGMLERGCVRAKKCIKHVVLGTKSSIIQPAQHIITTTKLQSNQSPQQHSLQAFISNNKPLRQRLHPLSTSTPHYAASVHFKSTSSRCLKLSSPAPSR
jgi:hypothetical protein